LGPPRLEDWRHGEILHKIARHAQYNGVSPSLGVAPDLPRFNANNFALSARLLGSAAPVSRLVLTPAGLYPLEHLNYVIIADGDQGPAWSTTTNEAVNRIIRVSPMFQFLTANYRSEEHTSELQSRFDIVCRLLLDKTNSFYL